MALQEKITLDLEPSPLKSLIPREKISSLSIQALKEIGQKDLTLDLEQK